MSEVTRILTSVALVGDYSPEVLAHPTIPQPGTTPRKLALPRGILLLLSVTVWPLLIFLFHGVLPWVLSGSRPKLL